MKVPESLLDKMINIHFVDGRVCEGMIFDRGDEYEFKVYDLGRDIIPSCAVAPQERIIKIKENYVKVDFDSPPHG